MAVTANGLNMLCCTNADITTDMTVWDSVIVTPSDRAYEKKEDEEKEDVAATDEKMDTQDK